MAEELDLKVVTHNGQTKNITVKSTDKCKAIFDQVSRELGREVDTLRLLFAGKMLEKDKTISSYKIPDEGLLHAVFRFQGGSRKFVDKTGLTITTGKCPVELDDNVELAKLPSCQHHVSAEGMYNHARYQVFTLQRTNVTCFDAKGCRARYEFGTVAQIAAFTKAEAKEFMQQLNVNLERKMGWVKCPKCGACGERVDKSARVVCSLCSTHLCWWCGQAWNGGVRCGNSNCRGPEILAEKQQILNTCAKKSIDKVDNVPSIRACVNCRLFIEHKEKCKHMTCEACDTDFCFVCLKPKLNGGWQCGSYNTPCKVAPVQSLL